MSAAVEGSLKRTVGTYHHRYADVGSELHHLTLIAVRAVIDIAGEGVPFVSRVNDEVSTQTICRPFHDVGLSSFNAVEIAGEVQGQLVVTVGRACEGLHCGSFQRRSPEACNRERQDECVPVTVAVEGVVGEGDVVVITHSLADGVAVVGGTGQFQLRDDPLGIKIDRPGNFEGCARSIVSAATVHLGIPSSEGVVRTLHIVYVTEDSDTRIYLIFGEIYRCRSAGGSITIVYNTAGCRPAIGARTATHIMRRAYLNPNDLLTEA